MQWYISTFDTVGFGPEMLIDRQTISFSDQNNVLREIIVFFD
jgi:hypothetical protein